jgi:hypothetical protein
VLLSAIEDHVDPNDARFATFVMVATCAAKGRDTVLFAPSLPPRRLPRSPARASVVRSDDAAGVGAVVAVSGLLTARLAAGAGWAADPGDQAGCRDAAGYARQIGALLAGSGP